jgi:hypothetical protein
MYTVQYIAYVHAAVGLAVAEFIHHGSKSAADELRRTASSSAQTNRRIKVRVGAPKLGLIISCVRVWLGSDPGNRSSGEIVWILFIARHTSRSFSCLGRTRGTALASFWRGIYS